MNVIKIGTRGSSLAIKQAVIAGDEIKKYFKGIEIEIITIKTKGDLILDKTLDKIGGKGVFVKEIESALLNGTIDIAVHSMKDMPSEMPKGLEVGGVLKRENPKDALVSKDRVGFWDLQKGAKIGTGSLRRKAQLLELRRDLDIVPIRGNINTRINKLQEGLDAVVLAASGLKRNGMEDEICGLFEVNEIVPAGCQGILALQIRKNDLLIKKYTEAVNDIESEICSKTERAFLAEIGADCHAPIGVYSNIKNKSIHIIGMQQYSDGIFKKNMIGNIEAPEELGKKLGEIFMNKQVGK